jgi:hypothetical protein
MNERPISVGELLRREGQQSESHDSQARRALGGVAVGAVLAFGAVVGGLVLHNAGATPSDMPVAGGGTAGGAGFNGSVPIASAGTIGSHAPQVRSAANTSTTTPASTQRGTTPNGTTPVGAVGNSVAPTTDPQSFPSSSGTLPTTTGSASASTSTGSTSTSTGSTTTPHTTGSGTSTTSPSSTSTGSTTTTTSNSGGGGSSNGNGGNGGGGLLGTVGSTLGSVTQPVFNWFGGN